jgi:hypothetical protein
MRVIRSLAVAAGMLCSLTVGVACSDADVQSVGEDLGVDQPCIDGAKAMLEVANATSWTNVEDLDAMSARLQGFVDAVPEPIRVDVQRMFDGVDTYVHVYADHADELKEPDPDQAAVAAVDAAGKALDTAEMHDAAERVTDWLADHCAPSDG